MPSGITADYSASFFGDLERLSPERENASETDGRRERTASLPPGQSLSSYNPSTMSGTSWSRGTDGMTHSDSSEASSNSLNQQPQPPKKVLPPLPPRPPKRGILKQGPRSSTSSLASDGGATNADTLSSTDPNAVLARNTIQNEVITYQNLPSHSKPSTSSYLFPDVDVNSPLSVLLTSDNSAPSPDFSSEAIMSPLSARSTDHGPNIYLSAASHEKKLSKASLSPSAESLTDTTTNSSFATPPFSMSPIGESQGFHTFGSRLSKYASSTFEDVCTELPLPPITPVLLPQPRELTIQRQPPPRNDFGFSLRRAIIVERQETSQGVTVVRFSFSYNVVEYTSV